jgi:hypothetical protein
MAIYVYIVLYIYIYTSLHTSIYLYISMFTYFNVHIRPIYTSKHIYVNQFTYFYAYVRICMCTNIISNSLKFLYTETMRVSIPLILKIFKLKKSWKMYLSIANIRNAQRITIPNLQIHIYYIFQMSNSLNNNYIKKYFI